jgi:hypothetical protein
MCNQTRQHAGRRPFPAKLFIPVMLLAGSDHPEVRSAGAHCGGRQQVCMWLRLQSVNHGVLWHLMFPCCPPLLLMPNEACMHAQLSMSFPPYD